LDAVRISDNHVHNLVFELRCFILLMQPDVRWTGSINSKKWTIQNFLRACGYIIEYNKVLTIEDIDQ